MKTVKGNTYGLSLLGLTILLDYEKAKRIINECLANKGHDTLEYINSNSELTIYGKALYHLSNSIGNSPDTGPWTELIDSYTGDGFKQPTQEDLSNLNQSNPLMKVGHIRGGNHDRQTLYEYMIEHSWIKPIEESFMDYFFRELRNNDDIMKSFEETWDVFKKEYNRDFEIDWENDNFRGLSDSTVGFIKTLWDNIGIVESYNENIDDILAASHCGVNKGKKIARR